MWAKLERLGVAVFIVMSALNLLVAIIYLGYERILDLQCVPFDTFSHRRDRQLDGVGVPFLMVLNPILVSPFYPFLKSECITGSQVCRL